MFANNLDRLSLLGAVKMYAAYLSFVINYVSVTLNINVIIYCKFFNYLNGVVKSYDLRDYTLEKIK